MAHSETILKKSMDETSLLCHLSAEEYQSFQFLMEKRRQLLSHVTRLRQIAKRMGKVRKATSVASVTGNCLGVAGALDCHLGLSLSPVTFGASLLASTVGLIVAATGELPNLTSDLSLAVSAIQRTPTSQEIANDCCQQHKEILQFLLTQSIIGQELYDILGCSVSMDRPVCLMVLFGAHKFLVPQFSEEATKGSQVVLKAKVQRLVETIEACVGILDEICQQLRKTALDK
ncbi:LOW QUALITY PROTEIN: apolipoprotein L domain-containing protein 1 [Discoglossus pictus]